MGAWQQGAAPLVDSRLHSRYARVRTRAKLRSASRSATTCTNASITSYNFAACCLSLQLLRLRTADFLPLRSCCQSASDWCMSDESQQPQQEPSVLETLATAAKEDAKEFHGLAVYEGLLVSKPSDYQALSPEIFKFLKEDLSLAAHLPKAPSLGECSFLLSKKANLATELFNDTWTSASLNYAATAETYCYLAELVERGRLKRTHRQSRRLDRLCSLAATF